MTALLRCLFSSLLAAAPLAASAAEPLPLANGDFSKWSEGVPEGWKVAAGANSGGDKPSQLTPLPGGGIALSGDAATGVWRIVSQRLPVAEQAPLRLRFTARTSGLKREARQFDNCYIGLAAFDAGGQRLSMQVRGLFENEWAPGQLVAALPQAAAFVEVMLFLSKTGTLEVRDVSLEKLAAGDSFDVLGDELDRYYSFFDLKGIDWRRLLAQHERAGRQADTPEAFLAAVQPLLAELKDLHVTVELPSGKTVAPYVSKVDRNFDARTIARQLKEVKQVGRMGFTGRTAEGFGYIALGTLAADKQTAEQMLAAFDALLDAKGLIIDLRVNGGGSETVAQQFASRLVDQPLVYATNQFRSGPAASDLMTLGQRQVTPHQGSRYSGPVVGLIGPGCVSSGEGFALMLRALPTATLIGQNTRGASGNPQPLVLPNGVTVRYSTWVPLQLDGQPFEGAGIAPDLRIDDDPTGVKGLAAAIDKLK